MWKRTIRRFLSEALAGHFFGLWYVHDVEDGWCDVVEASCFAFGRAVDDNAGHGVGGVCGARAAVGVPHLFRVSVVGGDDDGVVVRLRG